MLDGYDLLMLWKHRRILEILIGERWIMFDEFYVSINFSLMMVESWKNFYEYEKIHNGTVSLVFLFIAWITDTLKFYCKKVRSYLKKSKDSTIFYKIFILIQCFVLFTIK